MYKFFHILITLKNIDPLFLKIIPNHKHSLIKFLQFLQRTLSSQNPIQSKLQNIQMKSNPLLLRPSTLLEILIIEILIFPNYYLIGLDFDVGAGFYFLVGFYALLGTLTWEGVDLVVG